MSDQPKWGGEERRSSQRLPTEIWVEQASDRELYFQRGANISTGGIFLQRTIPHPKGTIVHLRFTLPGEGGSVAVKGEIVNVGDDDSDLGMGVRFIDLADGDRRRIADFVARAEPLSSKGAG